MTNMVKPYVIFGLFSYLARRTDRYITANELGERFEVCSRTISRYIEAMEYVGVPVSSRRGRYGGFRLLPDKSFDRFLFSEEERNAIISAVKKDNTINPHLAQSILGRL